MWVILALSVLVCKLFIEEHLQNIFFLLILMRNTTQCTNEMIHPFDECSEMRLHRIFDSCSTWKIDTDGPKVFMANSVNF